MNKYLQAFDEAWEHIKSGKMPPKMTKEEFLAAFQSFDRKEQAVWILMYSVLLTVSILIILIASKGFLW